MGMRWLIPVEMDERRETIVSLVNGQGSVSLSQLKEHFPDVSETTLRTDLKTLDEQRQIIRVHGGAKSVGFALGTDDLLARRSARRAGDKLEIARKAAGLVREGTTIFIDSGSTTTALAAQLPNVPCYVFTNSVTVAVELARLDQVTTYVVGGHLVPSSMCMSGGSTIEKVTTLSFELAFMGVTGWDRQAGFTCGSDDEAVFKRTVARNASSAVALMDSSKVGRQFTFPVCRLDEVETVVCDDAAPEDLRTACRDAGVTLL